MLCADLWLIFVGRLKINASASGYAESISATADKERRAWMATELAVVRSISIGAAHYRRTAKYANRLVALSTTNGSKASAARLMMFSTTVRRLEKYARHLVIARGDYGRSGIFVKALLFRAWKVKRSLNVTMILKKKVKPIG